MPNQHIPLHLLYGPSDCCLCNAHKALEVMQKEYDELKNKYNELEAKYKQQIPSYDRNPGISFQNDIYNAGLCCTKCKQLNVAGMKQPFICPINNFQCAAHDSIVMQAFYAGRKTVLDESRYCNSLIGRRKATK